MTTFSYSSGNPGNLTGGHSASMSDISGPLTDIPTFLNGANIDTSNLATSAKPATLKGDYRTVSEAWGLLQGGQSSGHKYVDFTSSGPQLIASGAGTAAPAALLYLDPAHYAVSGLTAKFRVNCAVATNATAPAITFTFGLYPVTLSGASTSFVVTLGTVVVGSTVAVASPSASAMTPGVGSDFTPPTAGAYALGVNLSGTNAANAAGSITLGLQIHHV